MDVFRYVIRLLYRIRWYLVLLPLIALIIAWFSTRNMDRLYDVSTTVYTGMITGYNIEGGSGIAGGDAKTNIQNLMLIITTNSTLQEVSLRLFGRCMRNIRLIMESFALRLLRRLPIVRQRFLRKT